MIEISRIAGEAGKRLHHSEMARIYQIADRKGKSCLETDHAARSFDEGAGLFLCRMGGVVGGDDINSAVLKAPDDGHTVALGAKRRIDLGECSAGKDRVFCEGEVMGRRFSVNGRVLSAGPAHVFNAFLSADVLDAQRRVKGSGNFNISGDQCVFSLTGGTFEAQGPGCCAAAVDAVFGDTPGLLPEGKHP